MSTDRDSMARAARMCATVLIVVATRPTVSRADPSAPNGDRPPADPVYLRLVTKDPGVSVERLLPDGTRLPVCAAPCSQVVPRRDTYVVVEDGSPKCARALASPVSPDRGS
jgi:hypothetical protein